MPGQAVERIVMTCLPLDRVSWRGLLLFLGQTAWLTPLPGCSLTSLVHTGRVRKTEELIEYPAFRARRLSE